MSHTKSKMTLLRSIGWPYDMIQTKGVGMKFLYERPTDQMCGKLLDQGSWKDEWGIAENGLGRQVVNALAIQWAVHPNVASHSNRRTNNLGCSPTDLSREVDSDTVWAGVENSAPDALSTMTIQCRLQKRQSIALHQVLHSFLRLAAAW